MSKLQLFLLPLIAFSITACMVNSEKSNIGSNTVKTENKNSNTGKPRDLPNTNKLSNAIEGNTEETMNKTPANSTCFKLKRDDLMLDQKQTFAVDFKPFEKACFVTFHDPEFDSPPLGSQFYIYRNGKEIFNFPDQFNGGNTTCWVDGVSFADVNNDQLQDILIAGKCGGTSSEYNENMVYLNTGRGFKTNVEANSEMLDFSNVGEIKKYVSEHTIDFIK